MIQEFEYTVLAVEGVGLPIVEMNELGEQGWIYADTHNLPGGERGLLFMRMRAGTADATEVVVTQMPELEFTITDDSAETEPAA